MDDGVAEANQTYGEDEEPVRKESFDLLQDAEENLRYPPEQRNRDVRGTRSWSFNSLLIFFLQNLTSTTRMDPPPMNDRSHIVSWADMSGRRDLVSVKLGLDVDLPYQCCIHHHRPSRSHPMSYTPSEGFFFPTAPEQMSPMMSSSLLVGWDGEAKSCVDMNHPLAPGMVAASEEGKGRSQVPEGAQWPALAWGHVQPLGLQGGRREEWRGGGVEGATPWSSGGDRLERSP